MNKLTEAAKIPETTIETFEFIYLLQKLLKTFKNL